ncbi:transglycosylase SLT domain-containing protein, partial [Acinetobacter baumannii]|nr:transglycosylase SLT domain-containing protein [Acinetobacter baumannii]EKW0219915.1 transglycosylase SLT domain-containing protein [Acinetobacter baumannii]EKW0250093.1 transglycosylase SLT domain-containing protein [Acinetobacter baumannii]EKW4811567.1 transglycosylase SLT domain-containing protein [Acinetobacter baumannii]EKW7633944.1 transglycosylase SLT domain-containing protein [Acinetobacter baumannii]
QKHADAINNTKQAADEAQKSLQKMYADKLWDSQFVEIVMKKGFSESQANDLLKLYKDSIAKGLKAADREAMKSLTDTWKAEESIKAMTDARTDSIREQNKELKNQQKVLNVNAKVLANASKFGFADLESKYKLPSGTLSAIHMIESRGNAKAYNKETGATGGFQFLEGTAKQYGVKDRTDLAQSAEGAAKYMSYLLKLFKGDLEKAVRAYHAGEGNVMKGKGIGKNNDQYWKDYQSYMAGINGYSAGDISSKEFGSYLRDFAKTQEEIKQLQITYDSEAVARSKRREEEINKATLLGQMDLLPKIKERFDAEEKLAQKQFDFEVNGYKWTEEQKLDYTYETNSLRLVAEGKLSEDQRQVALDGLKLQKQQELELIELARKKQLLEAKSSYMGETELAVRRYQAELKEIEKVRDAKLKAGLLSANNMGQFQTLDSASDKVFQSGFNASQQVFQQNDPRGYAQWDLQNRYSTDAGGLLNTYIDQINGINLIADEEQRNSQLLAAREQYLQSRKALDEKYAQDERDLNSSLFETQLGQLGSLTSQLSGYWSNMTGIVKNAAGEQSGIYKGMYIAQQAFAIGSATISALQAYNQILASPWYLDVISKSTAANLVLGMGMANVGLIAGQTIAGFSDGGYTGNGLKHTPAGIVHKGEIVWSQEDIKRWGGVGLVEKMRKSANPEAFLNNNASADSVMRRAMMSSNAFIESQKQSDIFNQPVQDTQIIYKGNRSVPITSSSASSDLFHDGKVYFSSNGIVQDRSNLDDVQDFTLGRTSRPQAEIMPSIEPASPTINFKIEVINQVSGATVEAEQLDEQTVRIIVKDEMDKQLPRTVPKLVSDQIANPNSTISRSLTENTTVRRNR